MNHFNQDDDDGTKLVAFTIMFLIYFFGVITGIIIKSF